jgi:uncharacterized membrane protein (UPF0127 family)
MARQGSFWGTMATLANDFANHMYEHETGLEGRQAFKDQGMALVFPADASYSLVSRWHSSMRCPVVSIWRGWCTRYVAWLMA